MAEDDIAFLLNRGELVEPHDNKQAEVNTILDKSFLLSQYEIIRIGLVFVVLAQ
jgi:hypothetical protein